VEINGRVCEGCCFSPALFNIYINGIFLDWNTFNIKVYKKKRNKEVNTLLFAGDQILIAKSETLLQKLVHKLENIISKYGLRISTNKTNTIAFRGRDHIRSKIVINNKVIECVNTFN
jgi:hypothetical protein